MAANVATLNIAVNSAAVRTATKDIDGLGKAAEVAQGKVMSMCKGAMAVLGVVSFGGAIKEVTMLAARYDTLGLSMQVAGRNAGYSRREIEGYEKSLRQIGISATESRQSIMSMTTANIKLEQSTKLARLAQDLAVVGGRNSSETFNTLIDAIQKGNTVMLRNLGLNVQFKDAYENTAKAVGGKVKQLSEAEKIQARVNQLVKAGVGYEGIYEQAMESSGKKIGSLSRHVDDLKVNLGTAFQPALAAAVDALTGRLKDMNKALEDAKASGDMNKWANRFKTGMDVASSTIGGATKLLWEHRDAILAVGSAYASVKIVNFGKGVINNFKNPLNANGQVKEGMAAGAGSWWQKENSEAQKAVAEAGKRVMLTESIKKSTQARIEELQAQIKQSPWIAKLTNAHGALAAEQNNLTRRTVAHIAALKAQTIAQSNANKAKIAGRGIITAMGGPIGLAIAAIAALGYASYKVFKAMESDASKANKRLGEVLVDLREEVRLLERKNQLKAGGSVIANLSDKEITEHGETKSAIEKERKNLSTLQTELATAKKKLGNSGRDSVIESINSIANQVDGSKRLIEDLSKKLIELDELATFKTGQQERSGLIDDFKKMRGALFAANIELKDIFGNVINLRNIDGLHDADLWGLTGLGKQKLSDKEKKDQEDADKKRAAEEAAKALGSSQKSFLNGLKDEVATMGMSKTQTLEYEAAKLRLTGTNKKLAESLIAERESKEILVETADKAKDMLNAVTDELERFGKTDKELQELAINKLLTKLPENAKEARDAIEEVIKKTDELNDKKGAKQAADMLKDMNDQMSRLGLTEWQLRDKAINEMVGATPEARIELLKTSAALELANKQLERNNELRSKGESLTQQHMSPDEIYKKGLTDLNDMKAGGHINADAYNKAVKELRAENQRLRADMGDTWSIIGYTIQNSSQRASDALTDWINNIDGAGYSWKSLGDTVRQVTTDILADMQRMIMQKQVMEPLMSGIAEGKWFNKGADAVAGSLEKQGKDVLDGAALKAAEVQLTTTMATLGTSMTATLGTAVTTTASKFGPLVGLSIGLKGAFEGLMTAATLAATELGKVAASGAIGGVVGGNAAGGTVLAGSRYLVGERGPEIFTAPATGSIIPNHAIRQGGATGGDVNVTIVQNIQSGGGSDTKASGNQSQVWAGLAKQIEGMVKETIAKEQRLGNSLNPVFAGRGR